MSDLAAPESDVLLSVGGLDCSGGRGAEPAEGASAGISDAAVIDVDSLLKRNLQIFPTSLE